MGMVVAKMRVRFSFIGPDVLDEDNPRLCTPIQLTVGAGRFDCPVVEPVRVSTGAMNLQTSKRNIALCRSLEQYSQINGVSNVEAATPIKPDFYQFGWTDSCADGACQIVVDISFSGAAISTATGGLSDAVDIRVSGTLSGDLGGMSQVSMQFRKPGSTAIAGVCDWYPQSVDIGGPYQHVVFTGVGQLPTP
jgi:hypothetical protein